jgi:hypothetical protein
VGNQRLQVLQGSGQALAPSVRARFEPHFGRGFSDVRVHTDRAAAKAAEGLEAKAFTRDRHIVFGQGKYQPETREGQRLIAHELTHVVQQQAASELSIQRKPDGPEGTASTAHCTAVTIELPRRIVFAGDRGAVSAVVTTSLPPGDYWITYAAAGGRFSVGAIGFNPTEPPQFEVSEPSDVGLFGEYRDSVSREGVRLHVAGEAGAHAAAVPDSSITPAYAEGLDEQQLATHADVYRTRLTTLAGGPEYDAIVENLRLIQTEQLRRQALDLSVVGETGRPPCLPAGGSFVLQPADELPADIVGGIPEGGMITIPSGAPSTSSGSGAGEAETVITITPLGPDMRPLAAVSGESGGLRPTDVTTPLAAGSRSMLGSINAQLMQQGFAAAGPDAIGIVGVPRWFTPGARVPEAALDVWGHTAVYVRQGGRITLVRGFNPQMEGSQLLSFLRSSRAVEAGTEAVPAAIGSDAYLFTLTGSRSIEYPVSPAMAEMFAGRLPPTGPVVPGGATPPLYTARPAVYQVCSGSNCVLWAVEEAEAALGGPIGPAARGVSVTALGEEGTVVARTASQGRLIQFIRGVQAGEEAIAPAGATGAPVAAGMSRGLQVVKWGGRAFFVIGLATIPLEVALAPEGQRLRTGVGATAGFAGGVLAGAAAGLVCGPGAPVCSIVLGITFGIAGALGSRALAETIYDALSTLSEHPEAVLAPPSATTLVFRGGYAGLLRSPADLAAEMRQQTMVSGGGH